MQVGRDTVRYAALAVCASSVIEGRLSFALSLSASVALAVLLSVGVGVLTLLPAERGVSRLCSGVIAASVGAAGAILAVAYLGVSGLPAGILCASAVSSAVIIVDGHHKRGRVTDTAFACAFLSGVTILSAGIREVLGLGTALGREIGFLSEHTVEFLVSPAGGMTVCAVLTAAACAIFDSRRECGADGV